MLGEEVPLNRDLPRLPQILALSVCLLFSIPSVEAAPATPPVQVGADWQLLVDDWLIDKLSGTQLKLHSPVPRDLAFRFDAPWEGNNCAYVTMLQDGDQFRMYYRGFGNTDREYTCVAFSEDGIHWTRPKLGLIEIKGSKDNNAFFTAEAKAFHESHNFSPFIDRNPACKPDQRYKAVTCDVTLLPGEKDDRKTLAAYVSADGIHFKPLRKDPIITDGAFDSHNTCFWDVVQNQYVCYVRETKDGKKNVARCTSKDFVNWTKSKLLDYGDAPTEHFYTNGIVQYARNPKYYIGLPMRFIHHRECNEIGFEPRKTDGFSDAVFMSSHDGQRWYRCFMEAFVRPGLEPHNWGNAHINQTPAWGILQTSPSEISVYWQEDADGQPSLRRGTVRRDGFASVNATYGGGEFVTKPIVFKGNRLLLNVATSVVGAIRVEIQDAAGKPIPGYTLDECPRIFGDELERPVGWKNGADVSKLAGKPVRLRFVMKDADLFAFSFEGKR